MDVTRFRRRVQASPCDCPPVRTLSICPCWSRQRDVLVIIMNGKEAVLRAFDRLFDRAAAKLRLACDDDEKAEAKELFMQRFQNALEAASQINIEEIPEEAIKSMEEAIDGLSPAQIAGHLASIPLAHQAQQLMQLIANQAAEQRLIEQLIDQADDTYGGN